MLELYYNFLDRFYDMYNIEELEMDTDFLYLALSHEKLFDCIRPAENKNWKN